MSNQTNTEIRSGSRRIKRNWLFWFGVVFVVAGVYFMFNFSIRAIKEPTIAGTFLISGAFFCLVLAVPGAFLVWRSQKVNEADLRYQPLNAPVLDDNRSLSCRHCSKQYQPRRWPLKGDEIPYTIEKDSQSKDGEMNWECQDCGEVNYIVWQEKPGKIIALKKPETLEQSLKSWGIGLITMGVISIVFTEVFSQIWGAVLIILGILSLTIPKRGMQLAIGCSIILAGLLNILLPGLILWTAFGFLQIYWGITLCIEYVEKRGS